MVLLVSQRIIFVGVTLSAPDRESQPDRSRGANAVDHRFDTKLLRIDSTFFVNQRIPVKSSGGSLKFGRLR